MSTHISRHTGGGNWSEDANAGLEDVLGAGDSDLPYVVKSPWLYEWIDQLLGSERAIDGVIIPVRNLYDAATSRIVQEIQGQQKSVPWILNMDKTWGTWGQTPGGSIFSLEPLDQARILALSFYDLVERLTVAQVPMYFVSFPRMVHDGQYLYDQLRGCLPSDCTINDFLLAHAAHADTSKVRVESEQVTSITTAENAALKRELRQARNQVFELNEKIRVQQSLAQTAPTQLDFDRLIERNRHLEQELVKTSLPRPSIATKIVRRLRRALSRS